MAKQPIPHKLIAELHDAGYSRPAIVNKLDLTARAVDQSLNMRGKRKPPVPPGYYTLQQVAGKLGMTLNFVKQAVRLGQLRSVVFHRTKVTNDEWIRIWQQNMPYILMQEAEANRQWNRNLSKRKRLSRGGR